MKGLDAYVGRRQVLKGFLVAGPTLAVAARLNGNPVSVDADNDEELLWVLRDRLDVKGVKYSCGMGLCGACTSHINGKATRTCITPVSAVSGKNVSTIDGLAKGDQLHPVQQAWIDNDVAQCGYCQAGQIMQAVSLLNSNPHPTDALNGALQQLGRPGPAPARRTPRPAKQRNTHAF